MKRLIFNRHISGGLLVAAILCVWCVWTQGTLPNVVTYAGEGDPLQKRWEWALGEAAAGGYDHGFWIGYSITKWIGENEFYGDDCIRRRESGRTIEELIGGRRFKEEGTDEEDELKRATLLALWNLGDEKAISKLREEGFWNEGRVEKEVAILVLYEMEKAAPRLEDVEIRRIDQRFDPEGYALFWLGHAGDEQSIDLLWDRLGDADGTALQKRIVTAVGIHHTPEHVVPVLEKVACGDYGKKVRGDAIFWLGQQEGRESVTVLKRLVREEEDAKLREKVIFSLHCHDGDEAISVLADAARTDRSTKVRKNAVFWLGQMAARKTLDILSEVAFDSDETEIQEHAVFAISQHSDREAVPMLIEIAKKHRNPQVRKKAIFWLGQTDDERALNFFVELLRDE